MLTRIVVTGMLLWLMVVIGCSGERRDSKETIEKITGAPMKNVVPVKGTILVDGNPEAGVWVILHNRDASASAVPQKSKKFRKMLNRSLTDAKGAYCFTTYTTCDGLEPGDYQLTFEWLGMGTPNAPDKLNGRYSDPQKAEHPISVKAGEPPTNLDFELTTK